MTGQETLVWTIKLHCDQKYIYATFLSPKSVRLKVWDILKSVLFKLAMPTAVAPKYQYLIFQQRNVKRMESLTHEII